MGGVDAAVLSEVNVGDVTANGQVTPVSTVGVFDGVAVLSTPNAKSSLVTSGSTRG